MLLASSERADDAGNDVDEDAICIRCVVVVVVDVVVVVGGAIVRCQLTNETSKV